MRHDNAKVNTFVFHTRCSLLVARCSLLVARCSLLVARCSLLVARCPIPDVRECRLRVVSSSSEPTRVALGGRVRGGNGRPPFDLPVRDRFISGADSRHGEVSKSGFDDRCHLGAELERRELVNSVEKLNFARSTNSRRSLSCRQGPVAHPAASSVATRRRKMMSG